MRIVVIGESGQLARRIAAAECPHERVFLGRSVLDLARPETISPALHASRPDLIVNAAAYTAVDRAESEEALAHLVNATGPGEAARVAESLGVPFVQVSTDYVFDGAKPTAYVEEDPTRPLGAYGRTKLAGESEVAHAAPRHVILRTAWVYAPEGANFVKTMLRLAADRAHLKVVADQHGSPTFAGDLADTILQMAPALVGPSDGDNAYGIFHAAGTGQTSWAEFAETIFSCAVRHGLIDAAPSVEHIPSADYPTPAPRPGNSVLDCTKLQRVHGLSLPDWRTSLDNAFRQHGKQFVVAT